MNLLVGALFGAISLLAPPALKAAEDPLTQWAGLWCSGRDEIGVFMRADGPGQTEPLYLYVERELTDADSYTVQGDAAPIGHTLSLTDGDCVIRAELSGEHLLISDNRRCERMSGSFSRRSFTRIRPRIHMVQGKAA